MEITTYTHLRKNLKPFLDRILTTHLPLFVTYPDGKDVVIITKSDYQIMEQACYLPKSE